MRTIQYLLLCTSFVFSCKTISNTSNDSHALADEDKSTYLSCKPKLPIDNAKNRTIEIEHSLYHGSELNDPKVYLSRVSKNASNKMKSYPVSLEEASNKSTKFAVSISHPKRIPCGAYADQGYYQITGYKIYFRLNSQGHLVSQPKLKKTLLPNQIFPDSNCASGRKGGELELPLNAFECVSR